MFDARGESARYSERGTSLRPIRDDRGEVIYDSPQVYERYSSWLAEHPHVRRLDVHLRFRTYLTLVRPQPPRWSTMNALAVAEWTHQESYARASPGEAPTQDVPRTSRYWVIPSPPISPDMRWALSGFTRP